MRHKELYKDVEIKRFTALETVEYLKPIVKIEGDTEEWIDNESDVYLWALLGKNDSNSNMNVYK